MALHVMREIGQLKYYSEQIQAQDDDAEVSRFTQLLQSCDMQSVLIGKRLVTSGNVYETLRFCADMVDGRVQHFIVGAESTVGMTVSDVQPGTRALWEIVQASRQPAARQRMSMANAAANAMMILNAGGIVFGGCNLSNATLGPTLEMGDSTTSITNSKYFMDVSGGVFVGANLSGAVLANARLDNCNFSHAVLDGADMRGVAFGQRPMLLGHTFWVNCLCCTADGKYAISGSNDHDCSMKVWDIDTGECVRMLQRHFDIVNSVCVTFDCQYVVSSSHDNTVKIWSFLSGDLVRTLEGHSDPVTSVCITPDNQFIVSGSDDGTARIWSIQNGVCVRVLIGHRDCVNGVAVTPDGSHVITCSGDSTIKVWSFATGECLRILRGHEDSVNCVTVASDGKHIVSGSYDNTVRVWDFNGGDCLNVLQGHTSNISCVCVTADGKYIVSGSQDTTVRVWEFESGNCVRVLNGHSSQVTSVCVVPQKSLILSGSSDATIRVWTLEDDECLRSLSEQIGLVLCASFTADGRSVITASHDGRVCVLSLESGECLRTVHCNTNNGYKARCAFISHDWKTIAFGYGQPHIHGRGEATLWSLETGRCLQQFVGHTSYVHDISITRDGTKVISGSSDKTMKVWSVESGICLCTLEQRNALCVCTTSDDKHVIVNSFHHALRVWSMETGECEHELNYAPWALEKVSWRGFSDKTLRAWALAIGKCVQTSTFQGHTVTDYVKRVCASNDNSLIASGTFDGVIQVWSFESGECLAVMHGHDRKLASLKISTDGKYVVSGSFDGSVCVWALWDADRGSGNHRGGGGAVTLVLVRKWASSAERLSFKHATFNACTGISNGNSRLIEQLGGVTNARAMAPPIK